MEGVFFWMGGEDVGGLSFFSHDTAVLLWGVTLDLSQASVLPGRKDGLSSVVLEDGSPAIGDRGCPHGASRLDAGVQFLSRRETFAGLVRCFRAGTFCVQCRVQGPGRACGGV